MNLLQLANRALLEFGVTTQPLTTTVGQVGEIGLLISQLQSAWIDIQADHQDWDFMLASTSFETVAGQAVYTHDTDIGLTDFGKWDTDTFRNYVTSVGDISEVFMDVVPYDTWRNSYQYGALRYTQSRPLQFTVTPEKAIGLGPVPTSDYTVTCNYFKAPSELASDTSSPSMPSQYHMAIVYRAMISWGMYQSAGELVQRGREEFDKTMRRLAIDRLPQMQFSGALV